MPEGAGTNDGISTDQYSLDYIPVDNIVTNVRHHGTVGLLFKVDILHAFRNVPVHAEDWCMLGMKWNNQYYVAKVSPFGLRSSSAIFNMHAVCRIFRENYGLKSLEHYLYNFVDVGSLNRPPPPPALTPRFTAAIQKATLIEVFNNHASQLRCVSHRFSFLCC